MIQYLLGIAGSSNEGVNFRNDEVTDFSIWGGDNRALHKLGGKLHAIDSFKIFKSVNLVNFFQFDYKPDLNDLKVESKMYQTESFDCSTCYNEWNFTDIKDQRDFYESNTTNVIFKGEVQNLGSTGYGTFTLHCKAELIHQNEKQVKTSFMGIPVSYQVEDYKLLIIDRFRAKNHMNLVLNNAKSYNSSTVYIVLDIAMIAQDMSVDHYNVGDILMRIGGMIGFVTPILGFFGPFLLIYFLYELAKIL